MSIQGSPPEAVDDATPSTRLASTVGRVVGLVTGGLLAAAAGLGAQAADGHDVTRVGETDSVVTSRHQVVLDGDTLRYTARAGRIAVREDETGEPRGHMFFIAYSRDRDPSAGPRPLTFLWNGGPGSSSSLVHLVGFGPERIGARGEPQPNRGTWLEASDLVFVDPVGTGYSRPAEPGDGSLFYQNRGDALSIAEFIRVYRNRAEAWDAPVFLAGESFGVGRAVRVADVLRRRGIPVTGLMLLGLNPPLADLDPAVETALQVPSFTAAAHHHGELPAELQGDLGETLRRAETWALEEYAPALSDPESLSERDRQRIRERLADFLALDPGVVDSTLSIDMDRYRRHLLRDENLVVGRYDSRVTGPLDTTRTRYDPTEDPSLEDIVAYPSVVRYLRSEIGYRSDLRYQGPFGGGFPPPDAPRADWMSVRWDWSAEEGSESEEGPPALQRLLEASPRLRVYVACGHYDLVCPYAANDRMEAALPPELRSAVETHVYGGGHAIYTDSTARVRMKRDVRTFIEEAVARWKSSSSESSDPR